MTKQKAKHLNQILNVLSRTSGFMLPGAIMASLKCIPDEKDPEEDLAAKLSANEFEHLFHFLSESGHVEYVHPAGYKISPAGRFLLEEGGHQID